MTLNQYLPFEELQKTLDKKQLHDLDFILDALVPNKRISVLNDRQILGKIHHSTKVDQYKNVSMRIKFLTYAPSDIRKQYFLVCGYPDPSSMNDDTLHDEIKRICDFTWGNNQETKNFVVCFGYPDYLIPTYSYIEESEESVYGGANSNLIEPLRLLFEYQSKLVFHAFKKLQIPNMRFLIQMPTGTGKTRTAMDILVRYINENPNCHIVWLAHSSELLSQAVDAFQHVWSHVGQFPISIYRMWGDNQIKKIKCEKSIVFAGYDKLKNYLKKDNVMNPDMIIIDEAHRILAPQSNELLDNLSSYKKNTKIFGLTATPGRGIDSEQNQLLVKEFHNKLIGIELDDKDVLNYEDNIVEYLQDHHILARAEPQPLETHYEYHLSKKEWENLTRKLHGDYTEFDPNILQTLADDNKRNILIIRKLKKYADDGKKILYFSTDLKQSIFITAILTILGIKAIHVDGDTDKGVRKEIVNKFKNSNEINVICNFNIFSTGFDVPNLDVVFISRPINSPVLFNQIVGRGTRGPKMGGHESFILVQVMDNIHTEYEFNPYKHYARWDDNWRNNSNV